MSKPRGQRPSQSSQCDSSTPVTPRDTRGLNLWWLFFGGFMKHACLAMLFLALFAPFASYAADADTLAPHDFLRLKLNETPPVKCDVDHTGTVALDSVGRVCVCSPLFGVLGASGGPVGFGWMPVPMGQTCGLWGK